MSGKRPWQVTGFEDSEGKLLVDHNTFYNVAYKKQFFNTNTLKGQAKYKYEFYSNIFVNVSNKKIYGNMASNKNQLGTDGKNTYLWDGEFFSETNYNGDEGLQTDPSFKDADNGDFTVGKTTDQYANKTGDPRWTSFKVKMADGVMDADKWTISPTKAAEGTTVTATYNGTKKVIGVKAAKKAANIHSITIAVDPRTTEPKATAPAMTIEFKTGETWADVAARYDWLDTYETYTVFYKDNNLNGNVYDANGGVTPDKTIDPNGSYHWEM